MRANLTARREQVVDARSAGRFHAREPEPRAGPALGPHPGCEEPALCRAGRRRRHLEAGAPSCAGCSPGAGVDLGPAGRDQLRLGRVGGADQPRPVRARRAQRGALRRLLGGMGRAGGHAGGQVSPDHRSWQPDPSTLAAQVDPTPGASRPGHGGSTTRLGQRRAATITKCRRPRPRRRRHAAPLAASCARCRPLPTGARISR